MKGGALSAAADASGLHQVWATFYNGRLGKAEDFSVAICADNAGNVYVTGTSSGGRTGADIATIKYNSAGTQQWVARYNDPVNGRDEGRKIAVDAAGNVYAAGSSNVRVSDYVVIKYDALGQQLWTAQYDGPGSGYDYLYDMALDNAGNVYVTGGSGGEDVNADYATVKFDKDGTQLWAARYDAMGQHNSTAYALILDRAGNVYVTGASAGASATIKYDAAGEQLWAARSDGPYDSATALAVDRSGNVFVTGSSFGSETNYDYLTIKYSATGSQLWARRYNGPDNFSDNPAAIALDGANNAIVTGQAYWDNVTGYDMVTIQYDTAGNQRWLVHYGTALPDDEGAGH